jgi:phosphate transport system permease protein
MKLSRQLRQQIGFALLSVVTILVVLPIMWVVGTIVVQGAPAITWEFVTAMPRDGMRAGGVWPAIVGTVLLTLGTAVFAVPVGVAVAIYLAEYALGLFVIFLQFGTSILAGSLTLAIMTLPVIISTAEEALRAVPQSFRIVSFSLGGTRWQTIRRTVLPQALPGILTGVILGLERAAGETAPILFTVAAFFLPRLPHSIFDQTMALPYHLFVISAQVPGMPVQIQYGTALVLLIFVLSMNILAAVMRSRFRAKRQW